MNKDKAIRFAGLMENYLNIPSFVCEAIEKHLCNGKYKETIEYVISRRNEIENKENYRSEQEIINKCIDLQTRWNSLRECIIGIIEGAREELNTIIHTTDSFTYANQCCREFDVIRKNLEIVLDKMNELEGDVKQ